MEKKGVYAIVLANQCGSPYIEAGKITLLRHGVMALDCLFNGNPLEARGKMMIPYSSIAYIEYPETESGG